MYDETGDKERNDDFRTRETGENAVIQEHLKGDSGLKTNIGHYIFILELILSLCENEIGSRIWMKGRFQSSKNLMEVVKQKQEN